MRRRRMVRRLSVLTTLAAALLIASGPALGDTFAVKNNRDAGPGSLRQAITDANANPGRDVIRFAPDVRGVIGLKSKLPPLVGNLEIRGPGADELALRRSAAPDTPKFRVLAVESLATVRISGMTISNGWAAGPDSSEAEYGGGVLNDGTLTLKGVVVSASKADFMGGGVANDGELTIEDGTITANYSDNEAGGVYSVGRESTLTVRDSTISRNVSDYSAGGIMIEGGEATIDRSTFSNNSGFGSGSGIFNYGKTLVRDSTFSGNDAGWAYNGGAIANYGDLTVADSTFSENRSAIGGAIYTYGTLTVRDSTFSGNNSDWGGAIQNYSGTVSIWGSTFSANESSGGGGGDGGAISNGGEMLVGNSTFTGNRALGSGPSHKGEGGAIFSYGDLTVTSSTFAGNTANGIGGGINIDTANLRANILAKNEAPEGPNVFGTVTSRGYNLIGDPSGATGFRDTDLTNRGPGLDPRGLRDNGGPTQTIALTGNSPALDAVAEGCPPPATDQRGVSRPQNGDGEGGALCDIGAYERRAPSSQ